MTHADLPRPTVSFCNYHDTHSLCHLAKMFWQMATAKSQFRNAGKKAPWQQTSWWQQQLQHCHWYQQFYVKPHMRNGTLSRQATCDDVAQNFICLTCGTKTVSFHLHGKGPWIEFQLYILRRKDMVDGGRHLVYKLYCGCVLVPSEGPANCVVQWRCRPSSQDLSERNLKHNLNSLRQSQRKMTVLHPPPYSARISSCHTHRGSNKKCAYIYPAYSIQLCIQERNFSHNVCSAEQFDWFSMT
jgi:hypothetical protein